MGVCKRNMVDNNLLRCANRTVVLSGSTARCRLSGTSGHACMRSLRHPHSSRRQAQRPSRTYPVRRLRTFRCAQRSLPAPAQATAQPAQTGYGVRQNKCLWANALRREPLSRNLIVTGQRPKTNAEMGFWVLLGWRGRHPRHAPRVRLALPPLGFGRHFRPLPSSSHCRKASTAATLLGISRVCHRT